MIPKGSPPPSLIHNLSHCSNFFSVIGRRPREANTCSGLALLAWPLVKPNKVSIWAQCSGKAGNFAGSSLCGHRCWPKKSNPEGKTRARACKIPTDSAEDERRKGQGGVLCLSVREGKAYTCYIGYFLINLLPSEGVRDK